MKTKEEIEGYVAELRKEARTGGTNAQRQHDIGVEIGALEWVLKDSPPEAPAPAIAGSEDEWHH